MCITANDLVVRGYYALAAGAVTQSQAPGATRRNVPEPVPVMVLGRLAVDHACKGQGLGADLLRDAVLRTSHLALEVGVRALLVHALAEASAVSQSEIVRRVIRAYDPDAEYEDVVLDAA